MSRFSSFFKTLSGLDDASSLAPVFYGLIPLAFLAYVLPWVHNPGQALTLGGYDLAEWLSLHAGVRFQSPPMLASALVRLHLVILAVLSVLWIPRRLWLITLVGVAALVIAQLPPPEFLSQSEDMNYRQQLGLAVFTLIVCAGVFFWRRRSLPTLILAVIGVVLCAMGVSQSIKFMQDFKLTPTIGIGAPLLAGLYLGMIAAIVRRLRSPS